MQIVVEDTRSQHEADLQLEDQLATVGDLVRAAGGSGELGIVVEGRYFSPDLGLDEVNLHEGAVVRLAGHAPVPSEASRGPMLAVVDGPAAGARLPLSGDRTRLGRDESCDITLTDPTLSGVHAEIGRRDDGTFTVTDCASRNGTWLDGEPVTATTPVGPGALLRLGATHVRLLADATDDRPLTVDPLHRAVGGLVPFNRPPRPALPDPPERITAPDKPAASSKGRALSIISIVAPIVLGGALVVIYGNPRFALFLLLSPVIATGNWLSGRRQAKKENVASSKELRAALGELGADLEAAVRHEVRRREVLLPDLSEVARRVRQPSTQLWQRRPGHDDHLRLRAGLGDVPWEPPVESGREGPAPEVADVVGAHSTLPRTAVEVDLSGGGVVGLVGDRTAALALARGLLVQAAAHHGPADLGVAVLAAAEHTGDWDWAKWLPHVRDTTGATRLLAAGREQVDVLLGARLDAAAPAARPALRFGDDEPAGRTTLYVLDDVHLTQGRRAPARLVLRGDAGPAAGIVIAETVDQLPAVTSTVVHLRSDLGDADLRRPQAGTQIDGFVISGLTEPGARDLARTLARYEDAELEVVGAGIPLGVRLLPILGMDEIDADTVTAAWRDGLADPHPSTPIGVGEEGIIHLDLGTDGPHGLVGGTTGSGKSELLRSMVAGMAARADPDHLVFVLVDYKGGSAFDECAKLPHTVGMVTDLDEHLGERALQSLEAELHHRERLLRDAGAQDLLEYARLGAPRGPLPRLVVVIDEFATLAAELPDFLGALVGIAQRGRSLGVHMILATQRPQGAVNANIKANTNLRIALRVQDAADSTDIIDRPDAASISRSNPGRAYIRLGPTDVALVQTALSTATTVPRRAAAVRLLPFRFGPVPPAALDDGDDGEQEGATDLTRLVAACRDAFERSAMTPPRRPWLPMLDETIGLGEALAHAGDDTDGVVFALADEPKLQRRAPVRWTPREGHLGLFGMVGSGTTTALLAVACALAQRSTPDDCHLYALDFGAGGLAPLAALPHTGGVIGANDSEGQYRLVRILRRELDRRRDLGPAELAEQPRIAVAIDGIGAFLAEHESTEGADVGDMFRRVFADGPTVGIVCVVTGDRVGELPMRLSSLVARKLLFRHADPSEFVTVGIRVKSLPQLVPGRAIDAATGLVVQVGDPGDVSGWIRCPEDGVALRRPPAPIRSLPAEVRLVDLDAPARLDPPPMRLPIGRAEEDFAPVALELHPTDHALIVGPPRSGKTTALMSIAAQVRAADPGTVLLALCDERSVLYGYEPLDAAGGLDDLVDIVQAAVREERRWLILVDNAPMTEDVQGALASVLRSQRPNLHVIAAGRTDDLRGGFSHWTRPVRQSRTGIILQPNLGADGELFSLRLPRRVAVSLTPPGRGFVVNAGEALLVQLALPPDLP